MLVQFKHSWLDAMPVMVLGYKGMLGRHVVQELGVSAQTPDVDITNKVAMFTVAREYKPTAIINCAGAIAHKRGPQDMIKINGLGPHIVAEVFDCPIIHVSTDCVFNGARAHNYFVNDSPDASDIYGRSKIIGEVNAAHVTNVRTSFIGPDHGFLKWLLDARGKEVEGWTNAIWSGSTVQEVARKLVLMVDDNPGGIQHLAANNNISKFELAKLVIKQLDLNVTVRPVATPVVWRGLRPTITMRPVWEVSHDLGSNSSRPRSASRSIPTRVS